MNRIAKGLRTLAGGSTQKVNGKLATYVPKGDVQRLVHALVVINTASTLVDRHLAKHPKEAHGHIDLLEELATQDLIKDLGDARVKVSIGDVPLVDLVIGWEDEKATNVERGDVQ